MRERGPKVQVETHPNFKENFPASSENRDTLIEIAKALESLTGATIEGGDVDQDGSITVHLKDGRSFSFSKLDREEGDVYPFEIEGKKTEAEK